MNLFFFFTEYDIDYDRYPGCISGYESLIKHSYSLKSISASMIMVSLAVLLIIIEYFINFGSLINGEARSYTWKREIQQLHRR